MRTSVVQNPPKMVATDTPKDFIRWLCGNTACGQLNATPNWFEEDYCMYCGTKHIMFLLLDPALTAEV